MEPKPLKDLMAKQLPEETAEQAYRRGYRDGWVIAIEHLHELMMEHGLSRQEAYYVVYDHWAGKLEDWERRAACPSGEQTQKKETAPEITAEQRQLSPMLKRSIRG